MRNEQWRVEWAVRSEESKMSTEKCELRNMQRRSEEWEVKNDEYDEWWISREEWRVRSERKWRVRNEEWDESSVECEVNEEECKLSCEDQAMRSVEQWVWSSEWSVKKWEVNCKEWTENSEVWRLRWCEEWRLSSEEKRMRSKRVVSSFVWWLLVFNDTPWNFKNSSKASEITWNGLKGIEIPLKPPRQVQKMR